MRLFLAITLTEDIKKKITIFQDLLRSPFLTANWVHHDNFHITMKFLGNVSGNVLVRLEEELQRFALQQEPFKLSVSEIGVFPNLVVPRVLWAGTRSEKLAELADGLDSILAPLGFEEKKRDFVGHITLARIKRGRIKTSWLEERTTHFFLPELRVKKITLYQSTLTPQGPVYKVVKHFRFNGSR
ncbi:RNA 2',3'-cyclic phosphodiesterase [Candidatus Margulisiibacteriota bacterium]